MGRSATRSMNTIKRGGYVPDLVDVPGKTATFLETNSVEGVNDTRTD